ncbi:2Fe-2S iron-sulfur cluster-binding protein [Larkinella insperata]|uniref:2Fe-2S iron-sulfur cluster-binding protein n=1 Tax=Larkinella insperata TaxID=332158 RepID=A0ABW3QAW4_9BACT
MKTTLTVTNVVYPTVDSATLYFNKPTDSFTYYPGQHVAITAVVDNKSITRTYSLSTAPLVDDQLAITVKRLPRGLLSTHLVENARAGIDLLVEGPLGQFYTVPNPANQRHLILFAGGSGITPLYSMIRSILQEEPHSKLSLVYANRTWEGIIFQQPLAQLQQQHPDRFFLYHVLEQYHELKEWQLRHVFLKGSLSRLVIKKIVHQLQAQAPGPTEFYLCGPYGYMELIQQTLAGLGIPLHTIYKEAFFVPEPDKKAKVDFDHLPTQTVQLRLKGQIQALTVPSGQSILEAALLAGFSLRYSCQQAQCGTCRVRLLQGQVEMERNYALSAVEVSQGQILLCRTFPLSNDVLIEPFENPIGAGH